MDAMKRWCSMSATGIAILFVAASSAALKAAAVQLPELNGIWHGSGTDRVTPFDSTQQTNCRANIQADETNLTQKMVCEGKEGLHKTVRLVVHINGTAISGTLTQTISVQGTTPATLQGSVAGTRTENAANLQIHFGGLMPTVTVALTMNNPSHYSIYATTFAGTLMDVSFNRTGHP